MLCEAHRNGGLCIANIGVVEGGPLRVRTRGLVHGQTCRAFELRAHLDDTAPFAIFAHWASTRGHGMQSSTPVLLHWQQADATGLRLSVSGVRGIAKRCALPARVGNYVLLLDAGPGDARRLAWRPSVSGASRRIALWHANGAPYARPYLLLGVERET
jgi:hypothetical protein